MLRPLALAGLGVILLPREPGALPLAKHVLHQIPAELSIHPRRLSAVRILFGITSGDIIQRLDDQIIHIHPDGRPPIILASPVIWIPPAQAADPILAPQLIRVGDEIEHRFQTRTIRRKQTRQEREDGDVALVADMHALLVIVDGGIAVGLVRGAPVQVVDVADDGRFDPRVLGRVGVFADEGRDVFH